MQYCDLWVMEPGAHPSIEYHILSIEQDEDGKWIVRFDAEDR